MWESYISQNPETPTRTIDTEAIVITPRDSTLHTLNETATYIWEKADGTKKLSEIAASMIQEFDVEESVVKDDAMQFVSEAVEKGMMFAHASPQTPHAD